MAEKMIDFEKSLNELEKIISELEKGECSLDESISLFEKGMKHTENCREALEKAKNRILQLTEAEAEETNID